MPLDTRLNDLTVAIKTETKALRVMISGTNAGNVSGLNTAASNLVAAINEAFALANSAAAGNISINDGATNTSDAWSSSKIAAEITGAIATALEGEDLSDLAAAVAANAANAANLASLAQLTALEAVVNAKANAADVYTQTELGDIDADLVAIWNAA